MSDLAMSLSMTLITCCAEGCGLSFAVPNHWVKKRREDHTWWKCPNGHSQHFSGETEEEKLRRERDRLAQRIAEKDDQLAASRDREEHRTRQLRATRGVVTRTKRRVGNGVCPCCNRSFVELQRHMHSKHPDYAKAAAEE
jgi:hypothetical protein